MTKKKNVIFVDVVKKWLFSVVAFSYLKKNDLADLITNGLCIFQSVFF